MVAMGLTLVNCTAAPIPLAQAVYSSPPSPCIYSARRRSIASQPASCSLLMNSSGLWPWPILPGPQITVGIPAWSNNPPMMPAK